MRLSTMADLPPCHARIVIINVHTELVTTLAIASAHRFGGGMPILLLDCDATEASTRYFDCLMNRIPFDAVSAPAQEHGATLDQIFPLLNASIVLLLDSDAEIRDEQVVAQHLSYFDVDQVFGAGYINNYAQWMLDDRGTLREIGLLDERPWMPFVLLRSSHVREALAAGASFGSRLIFNDIAISERWSRAFGRRLQMHGGPRSRTIAHLPEPIRERLRTSRLPWLAWARRDYFGKRPNYVKFDTGTEVYKWLRYERGLVFAGMHMILMRDEVMHYEGVTRLRMFPGQGRRRAAFPEHEIGAAVLDRLREAYDFSEADLRQAPDYELYIPSASLTESI